MKRALETRHGLDLTGVHHVRDWMLQSYEHDIEDKSSLRRMINTNKGYQGIPHPMKKTEDGKYMLGTKVTFFRCCCRTFTCTPIYLIFLQM